LRPGKADELHILADEFPDGDLGVGAGVDLPLKMFTLA